MLNSCHFKTSDQPRAGPRPVALRSPRSRDGSSSQTQSSLPQWLALRSGDCRHQPAIVARVLDHSCARCRLQFVWRTDSHEPQEYQSSTRPLKRPTSVTSRVLPWGPPYSGRPPWAGLLLAIRRRSSTNASVGAHHGIQLDTAQLHRVSVEQSNR